jgi:outer membrane protein with beta-barrel domain
MSKCGILASVSLPAFVLILFAAAPPPAQAGHVNLFLGSKVLNQDDWAPIDTHTEGGIEASWGSSEWPVMIATDLLGSTRSKDVLGVDTKGTTGELALGVRKIWNTGTHQRVHPYIGGGISYISAKFEGTSGGITVSDDDTGVGGWVGGGIFWRLGSQFNLGVSARGSSAKVTLYGVEGNAGGGHFGVTFGLGSPSAE